STKTTETVNPTPDPSPSPSPSPTATPNGSESNRLPHNLNESGAISKGSKQTSGNSNRAGANNSNATVATSTRHSNGHRHYYRRGIRYIYVYNKPCQNTSYSSDTSNQSKTP